MPEVSPQDDDLIPARLSDGLVVFALRPGDPSPFQMSVCMDSFAAGLQDIHDFANLMREWFGSDMSSTPDGPLYDYQGQLEELLAAKRPEIAAVWPDGPGWGNPGANPLRDIRDFMDRQAHGARCRVPAHPVHQAPQEHWKRYLAASVTGQRDLTRDFEIPCWLDEALAFMRPVVPDPIRGGTFFYCPWIERLSGGLRSCGVGHVGWATGTRHHSARAYRRHYRRCHLS